MAKFTLEDTIKTFNYQQAAVLYWFCQGFSYYDIASMLNYEVSSVSWRMSQVYYKLGLDKEIAKGKKLHSTERRRILREKVCPIIKRLTDDNPDNLEHFPLIPPNVLEGSILDLRPDIPVPPSKPFFPPPEPPLESPPPAPPDDNPPLEPPPDFNPIELYDAWLAVWEDERSENPHPPKRPILWGRIIGVGLAVLLGCAVVGALAYWWGTRQNPPPLHPTPLPTNTQAAVTATFPQASATLTLLPTETAAVTLTPTLAFTETPIATETQSLTGLKVGDVLEDDRVSLELTNIIYNQHYDKVGGMIAPISFVFDFTNHSGQTLVLQIGKHDFHSVDNTGYETDCWFYHISGASQETNEPVDNGDTVQIVARCGMGTLKQNVSLVTLTVHQFTSLPESTWVIQIPH